MIHFVILNLTSVSRHPLHGVEENIISDFGLTTDSVKSQQRSGGVLVILLLFQNHYFEVKVEMIIEGEYEYLIVKLFENVDVSLDSSFNQIETLLKRLNKF